VRLEAGPQSRRRDMLTAAGKSISDTELDDMALAK